MWSDIRGTGSKQKPKEAGLLGDVLTGKWGKPGVWTNHLITLCFFITPL